MAEEAFNWFAVVDCRQIDLKLRFIPHGVTDYVSGAPPFSPKLDVAGDRIVAPKP
jgi:hypothetical protein